ncbi:uncharacterized protein PHALS_07887 [Plasmopara halstedii]|uniref:RxLR-like protein n=1 Tax=Plasmopara halstedii TaxID=4781 RepID=A0A0P1B6Q0_PLAHL|nr:uncharacterized protein PHALS_07887 [Plasmopara halstedii]CEG50162.1 hypothetical protein PHALS_07887 [Plasmopara halstedii]|eukprot:XP_024586531.1 hypothetical protein PHALS_07887 [Plasmopara halstedii]
MSRFIWFGALAVLLDTGSFTVEAVTHLDQKARTHSLALTEQDNHTLPNGTAILNVTEESSTYTEAEKAVIEVILEHAPLFVRQDVAMVARQEAAKIQEGLVAVTNDLKKSASDLFDDFKVGLRSNFFESEQFRNWDKSIEDSPTKDEIMLSVLNEKICPTEKVRNELLADKGDGSSNNPTKRKDTLAIRQRFDAVLLDQWIHKDQDPVIAKSQRSTLMRWFISKNIEERHDAIELLMTTLLNKGITRRYLAISKSFDSSSDVVGEILFFAKQVDESWVKWAKDSIARIDNIFQNVDSFLSSKPVKKWYEIVSQFVEKPQELLLSELVRRWDKTFVTRQLYQLLIKDPIDYDLSHLSVVEVEDEGYLLPLLNAVMNQQTKEPEKVLKLEDRS